LKSDKGMAVLNKLIQHTDVFVSNFRTAALSRLKLTYEHLKLINNRIIYATITGFGEEGSDADNPGYDPVAFWARGGMLVDFAEKGNLLHPPIAVGDIATGQALAGGICASLYKREKTGEGSRVFTSLLAQATYLNHDAIIESQYGEKYPKCRCAPRRALLNTYRCRDNKWIVITIPSDFDRYFPSLLNVIGRNDLIGDPRWTCIEDTMYEKAPELVEILDEAFGKMTQEEALAALEAIDAPVGKVQNTKEMMKDPQVLKNNYLFEIQSSDSKALMIPANPVKFADKNCGVVGFKRGPRLGAHSVEILKEHGYTEAEIQDLVDNNIVSQC